MTIPGILMSERVKISDADPASVMRCSAARRHPLFKALCSSGKLLTETFLAADVVAGSSTDAFPALILSVFVQTVFSG